MLGLRKRLGFGGATPRHDSEYVECLVEGRSNICIDIYIKRCIDIIYRGGVRNSRFTGPEPVTVARAVDQISPATRLFIPVTHLQIGCYSSTDPGGDGRLSLALAHSSRCRDSNPRSRDR